MIWIAPLAIVGMAAFLFIGGEIVMHLWNWLLPPLFAWRLINFWQALGILVLCRILFGGHGFRGGPRRDWSWRRKWSERWEKMTPEEREKFHERMGSRCGPFGRTEPKPTA
jgi:hypothetical protein